jgi:hypothetical protein
LATKSLFFQVTDRRRFCLIRLPSTFGPRTRDSGKLPDLTPLSHSLPVSPYALLRLVPRNHVVVGKISGLS